MSAPDTYLRPGDATDDAFLGGALRLLQPAQGYRAGIDAVLLAAAAPLDAGCPARVLDCGAGVGVVGLSVAVRVADAEVVLLEREARLVTLAKENIARNDLAGRVRVVEGAVGDPAVELAAQGLAPESFTHVLANPPFHVNAHGTASSEPLKAGAHAMAADGLDDWARFMARMAAAGGSATLIHKAEALGRLWAALEGRFGALKVLLIHPRRDAPAIRVIVQGVKGSKAPAVVLPGFVLHGDREGFTPEAEAIFRQGKALDLGSPRSQCR
jgi:FkbM family methyltransferase